MKKILFKGRKYIFGGDSLDEEDFIATKYQFKNGLCSFAHYFPEQGVMRFRKKIGERKDIKIIGDTNITPKKSALFNMLLSPTWPFNRV